MKTTPLKSPRPLLPPAKSKRRPKTAPPRALCDIYLQTDPTPLTQPARSAPLAFARTACTAAPPLKAAPSAAPPLVAQLAGTEFIGACAVGGAGLAASFAEQAAKRGRLRANLVDAMTLTVPAALVGAFAGLSVAGRLLAGWLPGFVVVGQAGL